MTGPRAGSTSKSSSSADAYPKARKRFGQHFLSDRTILGRIADAAELEPGVPVIEVGPGRGDLTAVLAERANHVIAVEIDRDLVAGLRGRFGEDPRVAVIEGDVLDFTAEELLARGRAEAPFDVVANLPYNVAAPILRRFLEGSPQPRRLVVMVQLEVAEALCARPPRMGLLGVATQVYADAALVMRVAPGAFNPRPKVQSAVVRLDVLPRPRVGVPLDAFFRIVRAGFGNPRKMLRNSLSFGLHVRQDVVDRVMAAAGVDATQRPHVLRIEDWERVTEAWLREAHT